MKKALLKDSIKEIKNNYKRFLSLLLMAFLGVGFFAGIRATSPDMVDSVDTYYKNQKMYDLQVVSTLGLTQNDIEAIKKIDGVDIVEGTYETDGKLEIDNKEIITKVLCVDELNKPLLIDGQLPQNANECVVEENFLKQNNKSIEDAITIEIENMQNDEGEDIEYLYNKELKIVGTVKSPLYISNERGNSTLGDGKIDYYIYVSKDNIQAKDTYTNIYVTLKDVNKYQTASSKYEDCVEEVKDKIEEIKEERENERRNELVESKIQSAKTKLLSQEKQLKKEESNTNVQLEEAKKQIEQTKIKLQQGQQELDTQKQEAEQQLQEAESKLIDAREKIAEIENPEWYILDRYANTGYSSFVQDKESVKNIGKVFPIVFFLVAVLISLTSMTRMVEEQRTQIGTLKALGYNKIQIASKYVMYSSLACIIGGLLGMNVGFILIPSLIWRMYEVVYQIPEFLISFNWEYSGAGLVIICACIIGATIYSSVKELRQEPAILMRPKAPKMGKRVLLERINFIWKRLSFSQKVTIRNIFRYKKRFMMTIIGILGCTSLILAGFGLKDSIGSLMPNQYGKIFKYDMQINLKDGLDENQKQQYIDELTKKQEIEDTLETYMTTSTAISSENEEDVQIIVPKNQEELEKMISLISIYSKEKIELQKGQICITDKLAQLLGIKQGDTITLKNGDEEKQIVISNVTENYVYHYAYMTKETYEELYQTQYDTNAILTKNVEMNDEQEENLATEIMNQNEVASLSMNSSVEEVMNTTMESLNYVVVVLIVSAGLLAFAVLYNLSNVNISERIRELATIKVLGFYDKEVYSYVTRETILLTIIGILFGLIGGYFLNYFIIGTCEIDMLRFSKIIHPISYLYAILITVLFTVIVNIFTYFALKKIDMIESLKSIE